MAIPTFVEASSASVNVANQNITCNYPASSQSGDLLVLYVAFQRVATSGTQTISTPSGWTAAAAENNTVGQTAAVFWRFRGAETSVTAAAAGTGSTSNMFGTAQIHAYRGTIDADEPILALVSQNNLVNSAAARTMPGLTTQSDDCALSFFYAIDKPTTGTATWSGATERVDAYSGTAGRQIFGSATDSQAVAGSIGTITATPSSADASEGLLATVSIRPPLPPGAIRWVGAEGGTSTITAPAAVQNNDVLICVIADELSSGTYTWPTGWVEVYDDINVSLKASVAYFIWTTGSPTTWTAPTGTEANVCSAYRNVDTTTPFIDQNFNNTTTDTTPTTPVVTNSADTGNWWVAAFAHEALTVRTYSSFSPGVERTEAASTNVGVVIADSNGVLAASTTFSTTATMSGSIDSSTNWIGILNQRVLDMVVSADDTGTGADNVAALRVDGAVEVGSSTESASARSMASDTGAETDNASARAFAAAPDSAASADNAVTTATTPAVDTANGVDTASVKVVSAETGSGTDTAVSRFTASASDSTSATDDASTASTVFGSDSGASTDSANATNTAITNDSALGNDTAAVRVSGAADSGTGTDSSVPFAADTVSGSDEGRVRLTDADSVSSSDNAGSTNTAQTNDTGSGSDSARVYVSGTESGTGLDNAVAKIATDTGNGVDAATVKIAGATDSGAHTDDADSTNTAQTADFGASVDNAQVGFAVGDSGTALDGATTDADTAPNEPILTVDTASVRIVNADNGVGADSGLLRLGVGDSIGSAEVGSIAVFVFGIDAGNGVDTAKSGVASGDSVVGTESSVKAISGELQASRLRVIDPETRTVLVARESRTISVSGEMRLTIIGSDALVYV